jgi:hypothetical protein
MLKFSFVVLIGFSGSGKSLLARHSSFLSSD